MTTLLVLVAVTGAAMVGFWAGLDVGYRHCRAIWREVLRRELARERQQCRNAAWVRAGYVRVPARPLSGFERN